MRLTGKQRYWQAVKKARLQGAREWRRFMSGEIDCSGTPTLDRERNALIAELDRAYEAGLRDGNA